jgi:spore maturation protein CgeB
MTMQKWDKTVLTVMSQWDYCNPDRGISIEKGFFFDNFGKLVTRVEPFWFDDCFHDPERLERTLLARAREVQPDLIFFVMSYTPEFSTEMLDRLKGEFPTFAWFGDDQWRFESFTARMAPHFTFVSTNDPWCVTKYRNIGITPFQSQWAAQPQDEHALVDMTDIEYAHDVSFVGLRNKYRSWLIDRLARKGIRVECFGVGWPNGRLTFAEMEQVFHRSRINLNISNSANSDIRFVLSSPRALLSYLRSPKRAEQIKARNFEIPLAGGFQLTNYVTGLERYLKIGEEVAAYVTPEDCAQLIGYYLENDVERRAIATRGHHRVKGEHTFTHRIETILSALWGDAEQAVAVEP